MPVDWSRWVRNDSKSLLFIGKMCCLTAIAFISISLSQPKIRTRDDLIFVTGPFSERQFTDGERGYHDYTFRLTNFSNSFKIKADFLGFFERSSFIRLQYNDTLTIAIAKRDAAKLNASTGDLFVYSITGPSTIFLDCTKAIRKHNSKLAYYATSLFFLAGLLLIYGGYRKGKKLNSQKNDSAVEGVRDGQ